MGFSGDVSFFSVSLNPPSSNQQSSPAQVMGKGEGKRKRTWEKHGQTEPSSEGFQHFRKIAIEEIKITIAEIEDEGCRLFGLRSRRTSNDV